ncbi:DEAD/DEAH box helicase [Pleomorphomonas oryzae]|uniref:DEAD/DEAH box helicase n=1 Tax=Pleomorphomonas oryzae TaxID=261934 RepID=UPI00146E349D|nr:DEAD/DEAH box helicase [Pleomorphomonas oryzae]
MIIELRPYQDDVVGKLRTALRSSSSVLAYAPTGAGKTVIAAAIIQRLIANGKRVIFCVHRVDLIVQTAKTFSAFDIPFSIIAGNELTNPYFPCFIASIQTLRNRLGKYPADYVFVDEAHLSAAAGWADVAKHYKEEGARLIGLSGSPERLDGKPLGDVWDKMVMGPSVGWLIEHGHLSKYRAFCPDGLDLSSVHTRKGEYVSSEVEELMAGRAILSNAVSHWKRFALGKRTIAFSRSVAASEELAATFRANGVMAVALDGETPQADRRAAFIGFADRQIDVIVNCSLFCEGFDLAAQVDRDVTIEAVLQHAPTQSLAKHLQQMGRGLRKKPEPAILLDLVGNIPRLGLPDEDREWSLEGRKKKSQMTRTVICPKCFAAFDPAPRCPICGQVIAKQKDGGQGGRHLDEVDGELREIDPAVLRRQRREEQYRADTLEELISLATSRGYKSPEKWAAHVFTARAAKSGAQEWN